MERVQNYECVACAVNIYTTCDTENPFPGTQMFVRARNKKRPQQMQIEKKQACLEITTK